MFDTVLVKRELIAPLVEQDVLQALERDLFEGFLNFQTKDLENALFTYKIDEDKKLMIQRYNWVQDPDSRFGMKAEDQEYELDAQTTEIKFYDWLGQVGNYDIFITFKATVVRGQVDEIAVHEIQKTEMEVIQKRNKYYQERRKNIEATFEWKLWKLIQDAEWKIFKLFRPLRERYNNFKSFLRKRYEERYPDEMFDSWRHTPKN
jgi:hypothetical protein